MQLPCFPSTRRRVRSSPGRGVPALVVDWGYWGSVGVVADDGLRARLAQQGILPITVAQGLDAFERALAAGLAQVLPVERDGDRVRLLLLAPAGTGAATAVLRDVPALEPHARLLDRCVAALPEVLRGRASGLAALMPGGSTDLVEAVYTSAAATRRRPHRCRGRSFVRASTRPSEAGPPAARPLRCAG